MKSSVKEVSKEDMLIIGMDKRIEQLRKAIWRTIHKEKGSLSYCDVTMALGIVLYELVHHLKPEDLND